MVIFLIGRYGASVGKVFWAKDGAYNVALVKLIFDDKIFHKSFLFYFLQSLYFQRYLKLISKTAQSGFNRSDLYNIELPIAPLPEQHRIVEKIEELFSELDNGVASLKKALEQLKTYRQAVLKWAFEGKLTEKWRNTHQDSLEDADTLLEQIKAERKRHYQQQLEDWKQALKEWENNGKETKKPTKPQQPKDLPPLTKEELSNLPSLPDGWAYTYLAYLGHLARGKSKHRPRNDKRLFGGKYPFIQTGEVKAAKGILRNFSDTYSEFGLQQSKLWDRETLCITIAANIAETCFLGIQACFPDSIVGFKSSDNIVNSKFIDYFIQSIKSKIQAFAPATAQKNINLTTLENLIIPFPSLQEQTQIVQEIESRLSICDQLEATLTENLNKAEALRQSILKRAFEGKLVL
ncbi:MAG: hypothetical protein BEV12_00290 [Microcystis aeruginosa CACIAM 03]|nr:MAG: hypothetical protein BEV12_00290 [Microcystis aeruginosa CACIAM 03]